MNLARLCRAVVLATALVLSPHAATATQVQTQPTEIITASPLSAFSDRAGLWPSSEIPQDDINTPEKPLSETYNSMPGLQAREEGSPTLSVRGSAQADRVLKLFEGIPLNLADGTGGSNLFVPTEALSSIRLFKGPASTFYGGSAMAGAADSRLRLFERPALRISLADDSGTPGTRSLFGVLPVKKLGENTQATVFQERKPGRFAYDSVSSALSGRREHNSQDLTRATATGEFRAQSLRIRPLLLAVHANGESPGPVTQPDPGSYAYDGTLAGVDVSGAMGGWGGSADAWNLRAADLRLWGKFDGASGESRSLNSRTSASGDLRTQIFGSSQMRTFIDARTDTLVSTGYLNGDPMRDTQIEAGQSYELPLSPTLTLQPAYRYRPSSGDAFKALGLLHTEERGREWLTYSEGFRPPSLSDRFANGTGYLGNPGLKPERSTSLEAGLSLEQGRRYGGFLEGASLSAALFQTTYDNFVETAPVIGTSSTTKINTGSAKTIGGEAAIGYGVSVWNFNLAYGYLDAKNENGDPLRLAPRHQLTVSAATQLGPVMLELSDTYWSSYFDRDFASGSWRELPAWSSVDFTLRTIALNDWEARAGVLDIFNSPREFTLGYPEPQRKAYASVLRFF